MVRCRVVASWIALVACLSGGVPVARGQVTDLVVSDVGGDVVLTWTTGTPPWRVIRSDGPDFYYGNRVVADGLAVATATDQEGASPGSPNHFYRVLESGEPDPPGFAANPPRPVPFVTSLSPDSGKAGDIVTISGGNFEPTGATMVVTFDGLIADIIGTGETQLIVEVPEDVLTGYVNVCRAGICSNQLLFKVVVGPPFQDLSSIAFEPGTGSLWVADRGTVDTVYELDAAGGLTARGTLNQALLGHPVPGDGSGRVYYGNSLDSDFNNGRIEYIDSATNAEVFFDNAGQSSGTTTAVRCEGIAANDLEPEVVYYLDGRANTIRRVVRDALAHDLSYGDQPFSFNSPAGARFDSAGNLYVSSTTALYRILPQEAGVELVASGFTAASGIDLSEDTGITMLLVADEATGAIWLVDGETGDKELVGSGLSAPVGVAFSGDIATGALFYDVAEPTRIVRLPDPRVEFIDTKDVRILLSKHGRSDSYPSRQMDDGQIAVPVKVTDKIDPAGTTVYFRVVDPKDPSKYLSGQQGDNLPSSPAGTITPSAVVAADGTATAVLTVDPNHSGNNYRVEVSLKPPPNFKRVDRSPIYTSWRRLYIEHDRMYKQGEFLTQTSGAGQPNPARVFVASSAIFAVGDEVHVLAGDDPSTPVGSETSEGEIGIVAAVGPGFVDLQVPLTLTYREPESLPSPPHPFSFIARRAGGTYDAQPSVSDLAIAFDDAFTEWFLLPDDGFLPHWPDAESGVPTVPEDFIDARSIWFFRNADRPNITPFPNHVHLVSAAQREVTPPQPGAVYGLTSATNSGPIPASNWSWIFSGTIALQAPTNIDNVTDHITAHELGHQLNVNPGTPEGHDQEPAWGAAGSCQTSNPVHCCLMFATTAPNTSGIPKLHAGLSAPSHDLLCIRTHLDDLNQDQCPPPFPGSTP